MKTSQEFLQRRGILEAAPQGDVLPVERQALSYVQRGGGTTITAIARNLNRNESTTFKWLPRVQECTRARHERAGRRRQNRLDADHCRQPVADLKKGSERCGFESGRRNYALARAHIEKYGAEYSKLGAQAFVPKLCFSWKGGSPNNQGAASERKWEELKERSK